MKGLRVGGLVLGKPGGFPAGSDGKEPACNAGDPGSTPVVGKIPWSEA